MFNLFSKVKKDKRGFSLVELLVVLLIMSIIASVAIPLYLNQQKRSSLSLAQSDTTSTGQEINSLVGDYTNFGTATGTITFPGGVATFSPMTGATGNGAALSTGPGTTTSIVRLSPNSTASGSYGAGASTPWCIVIANSGTYAQYANTGLVASQIGGAAPTCVNGLAVAGGPAAAGPYTYAWAQRTPGVNNGWPSIASSSDGTKLAAVDFNGGAGSGVIYTSTDSGATWTDRTTSSPGLLFWYSVASSSDGTRLAAVVRGGDIYHSVNSGSSWVMETSSLGAKTWQAITSSSDGTHLAAVVNGGLIYTSADSGVTWTSRATSQTWQAITSSSDGSKLVAVVNGGLIYTSADSGVTWTSRATSQTWQGIASSSDGSKLVAIINGASPTGVYTSADSGVTWTAQGGLGWQALGSIASSSDGTHLVVGDNYGTTGDIYTSADSGVTWTAQTGAGTWHNWESVASSSDGKHIIAGSDNTNIWIGTGS